MYSKRITRCNKIIEDCLIIAIFFLPMVNYITGVSLFVAFLTWLYKVRLLKKIGEFNGFVKSPLNGAQTAFAVAGILSVVFSTHIALSIQGFVMLSAYILTYFTVVNNLSSKEQTQRIVKALLISCSLVVGFGVVQFFVDIPISYRPNKYIGIHLAKQDGVRIVSTMYQANILAEYLTFVIPISIGMLAIGKSVARKIGMTSFVLASAFCLIFTYSRGAYLGFTGSLLSFTPFIKVKRYVVLILLIALLLSFLFFAPDSVRERVKSIFDTEQGFNRERLLSFQSAYAIINDYPVTGTGLYTMNEVYREYKLHHLGGRRFDYIHNLYLQIGAEMGLVGLVIFIWILLVIMKGLWKTLKSTHDVYYFGLAMGMWASFSGFVIHEMFDALPYVGQMGVFLWFMMGLVASLNRLVLQERSVLNCDQKLR